MAWDGAELFEQLMRFRPDGLSPNAWAVKAGVSRTIWQDLKRHGNPSRRTLERLLAAVGSSLAEFEALRIGEASSAVGGRSDSGVGEARTAYRDARMPPLPLVASQPAGEWGGSGSGIALIRVDRSVVLDHVTRPASLAGDREAFAVVMLGDSMWPRFRPGRRVAVSPAAHIKIGDDVLVIIGNSLALVAEMSGRTASMLELRQFTPATIYNVPVEQVLAVHKVLGELI